METQYRPLVGPVVVFMLAAIAAAVLLLVALTVWLSYVLGTVVGTCVLLGCVFALLAIVVYFAVLRDRIRLLRQRVTTIYEVAYMAHKGLLWAVKLFDGLLSLVRK